MSDTLTRAQYEAIIRRRTRAVDRALAAMLNVFNLELHDDPQGLDQMRGLVANIRTTLAARYPFTTDEIGNG